MAVRVPFQRPIGRHGADVRLSRETPTDASDWLHAPRGVFFGGGRGFSRLPTAKKTLPRCDTRSVAVRPIKDAVFTTAAVALPFSIDDAIDRKSSDMQTSDRP